MSVELLQTLSLVSFIVAGVLVLVAVALFFLLDVPKLYGDVSGRTARKSIEAIRQQNETSGNKAYKPSKVNANRGKLTDKITESGRLETGFAGPSVSVGTEKFSTATLNPHASETTVLGANETTVLNSAASASETTVLNSAAPVIGETTVLMQNNTNEAVQTQEYTEFTLEAELFFTGSSEIIE